MSGSSSFIIPAGTTTATCPAGIRQLTRETDQASAALIQDLKQRGMLDDTLVIWGGEFGRTNYCQGKLTPTDYGRDHHPRCFTALGGRAAGSSRAYPRRDRRVRLQHRRRPASTSTTSTPPLLRLLGIDHER